MAASAGSDASTRACRRRDQIDVIAAQARPERSRRPHAAAIARCELATVAKRVRETEKPKQRPRPPKAARQGVAFDKPNLFARQIAVPDDKHRHEIDVGDAENSREQQARQDRQARDRPRGRARTTPRQASAATSEEIATLAPKEDELNGASSDRYQSIETLDDKRMESQTERREKLPTRPRMRGRQQRQRATSRRAPARCAR